MTEASTQGIELEHGSRFVRGAVELLSSMRFAISLLTVICIASVIGTVLKQHEPIPNYVNQFGPFWADAFLTLQLNAVYSAWWFLLILAFLVVSTTLCIARNTPKILADLKSFKESIREQSLQAFHHKAEAVLAHGPRAEADRIGGALAASGWKVRLQERDTTSGRGVMVAARAGGAGKIGYIAAHSAIVLICLGGLFDGDLIVRAQTWLGGKSVYSGGGMIADVKPEHWLPASNPTFRGNVFVPEGQQSSTAILSQSDGILLQDLPFTIELKKFIVEYYSTGMPKLFASDVVLHDRATGEKLERRIEVNHPASYKGIEIYQASFEDGGSAVTLKAVPMRAAAKPFELNGVIGGKSEITNGNEKLTVEYTGLRVINVENFGEASASGADVRRVDLGHTLEQRLGAADKSSKGRELRNVGPSISYKLRDASGQAREYSNYMLPVDMQDGGPKMFLLGVRDTPGEPFRYLRIPADQDGSMQDFLRLHEALLDPAQRERAVQRYVSQVVEPGKPELVKQLAESANRALDLFAGAEPVGGKKTGGLQAIADFMEEAVPAAEREKAAGVLMRILAGAVAELDAEARAGAGLKPLPADEATARYMNQAMLALSDMYFYPAPVALELKDFKQVQASVFQVARAPGKTVVYLGCLLLILGIFAMLYVRERRVWVWLAPAGADGTEARMAMSTSRNTLDADREFDLLKRRLLAAEGETKT